MTDFNQKTHDTDVGSHGGQSRHMESSQIVTMHIQSVDQNKAIKSIKHTITELDRSKIEEQKKAVRSGYDMDIIPSDLATYGKDAKALLKELQSQNERMFLLTFLVMNTGETEQELETNVFQAVSIAQKHNCELCRLDFQQEQGLMVLMALFWSTDWMCMVTIWDESMSRKSFSNWSLRSEAVMFRKLTAPKMPPI